MFRISLIKNEMNYYWFKKRWKSKYIMAEKRREHCNADLLVIILLLQSTKRCLHNILYLRNEMLLYFIFLLSCGINDFLRWNWLIVFKTFREAKKLLKTYTLCWLCVNAITNFFIFMVDFFFDDFSFYFHFAFDR